MEILNRSLLKDLFIIFRYVSKPFKIKLIIIIFLSIISGLSEILTLGSVIPFLSILLDVDSAQNNALVQFIFSLISFLNLNSDNVIINVSLIFIIFVIISTILRIILVIIYTHWTHFLGIEIASIM